MNSIIFPEGFIIEQENISLDLMNEHSRQWNIERYQLEKGKYFTTLHAVHTPRIQIAYSTYSNAIGIKGDHPKGTVLLSFFSENSSTIYQHTKLTKNQLVITKDGDEIDLILNNKCTTLTLAVEEKYFNDTFERYFFKTVEELIKNKILLIKDEKSTELFKLISNWFLELQEVSFIQMYGLNYSVIENLILEELFSSISLKEERKKRKKFDISVAKTMLHESIEHDIEISQFVKELDISKRQLYNLFKERYGYSPKQYFQTLRLNAIQKELLFTNSDNTTISDIAYKYGYRHMSHFANEYKIMFGELPSKTFKNK